MKDTQVAETIAQQIGGLNRLKAFVGANNFVAGKNSLTFKFKMNSKMNCVKIELNGSDLYDVTFYKVGKFDSTVVKEHTDVYCDMLIKIFEETTGLFLHF